jgi:hypothetical protein
MDFVLSEWILLGFVDLILAQPRNLVGFVGFCRGKNGFCSQRMDFVGFC